MGLSIQLGAEVAECKIPLEGCESQESKNRSLGSHSTYAVVSFRDSHTFS